MEHFEDVWANDAMTCDVTEQVASQVEALHADNAPEFIYFLTLYHIFRRFLQDELWTTIRVKIPVFSSR